MTRALTRCAWGIAAAMALGCVASPDELTPEDLIEVPPASLEEVLGPEPPRVQIPGSDGRLSMSAEDPDSRNADGAEGNLSGDIAGPAIEEAPGVGGGGGGGGAAASMGVPWTCPPSITASASCAADFQRNTAFCDAAGRVTAAGAARSRTCNSSPNPSQECGFYLSLRQCHNDCSACQQNRLVGYFQTCRNMGQIAIGQLNNAGAGYGYCQNMCEYQSYVSGMRRCLQRQGTALLASWNRDFAGQPLTCGGIVNGPRDPSTGSRSTQEGIIGSHTYCNEATGFCALSPAAKQCFGAGLGNSWAGMCLGPGGQSPWGSWQSVGMCHLFAQAASCGTRGSLSQFVDSLCQGYQDGCMTAPPCAYMPQRLACMMACPRSRDMAQILRVLRWSPILLPRVNGADARLIRQFMDLFARVFHGDVTNVAAMEAVCEQVIGRDVAPGISCENPMPPPTRCCCRTPSGPAVSYAAPSACTANNGRPGFDTMTVDWGTCNQRGWTVADCNGAPAPSRPADPMANPLCYSSTLGRRASTGTCIQSAIDRLWYQCGMIGWVRAPGLPGGNAGPVGQCTAVIPYT